MKQMIYALWIICLFSVSNSFADNDRQGIINQLDNINNNWSSAQFKSWINNGKQNIVRVGDTVIFHFSAEKDAYLTMLEVDSYGVINISFPLITAQGEGTLSAGKELKLPAEGDNFSIEVEPPMGRDTIYIIASNKPVNRKRLGLNIDETSIPIEEAQLFINDLNLNLSGKQVATVKIEQKIVGRSDKVGYNENDIASLFEKKPLMRSFSRRKILAAAPAPKQQTAVKAKLNLYINFESGSAQLTESAKENLEQVGLAFQRPSLSRKKFVLSGHTDKIGDTKYNLILSKQRAASAKNYLANYIDASRLSTIGYGEKKPIESGSDKFSLAANRRVEIEEWQPGMSAPAEEEEEEERDGTIEWLDN